MSIDALESRHFYNLKGKTDNLKGMNILGFLLQLLFPNHQRPACACESVGNTAHTTSSLRTSKNSSSFERISHVVVPPGSLSLCC